MVSTLGKWKEGWTGAFVWVFFEPPEVLLSLLLPVKEATTFAYGFCCCYCCVAELWVSESLPLLVCRPRFWCTTDGLACR